MIKKIMKYIAIMVCIYIAIGMAEDLVLSLVGKVNSYISGSAFYEVKSENIILFQNRLILMGLGYLIYNKVKKP